MYKVIHMYNFTSRATTAPAENEDNYTFTVIHVKPRFRFASSTVIIGIHTYDKVITVTLMLHIGPMVMPVFVIYSRTSASLTSAARRTRSNVATDIDDRISRTRNLISQKPLVCSVSPRLPEAEMRSWLRILQQQNYLHFLDNIFQSKGQD